MKKIINVSLEKTENGFEFFENEFQIISAENGVYFIKGKVQFVKGERYHLVVEQGCEDKTLVGSFAKMNKYLACINVSYEIYCAEVYVFYDDMEMSEIKIELCRAFDEAMVKAKVGKESDLNKEFTEFKKRENIIY